MDEGRFHSYEVLSFFYLLSLFLIEMMKLTWHWHKGSERSLHYLIWLNVWDTIVLVDIYIHVHSNQEIYFLKYMLNAIVYLLKDENS